MDVCLVSVGKISQNLSIALLFEEIFRDVLKIGTNFQNVPEGVLGCRQAAIRQEESP